MVLIPLPLLNERLCDDGEHCAWGVCQNMSSVRLKSRQAFLTRMMINGATLSGKDRHL